ncbi:interleukin-13 receptor subunit alpha-2 isoform X2 [Callorhinchus milii]|nr:interleukin-13 receptor subunit alpha-2 isoform X2 [Callorhinchus milii]|eukprot:gi/632935539/ref/XP_007890449.1/ PREDICTED: interleukin-13 receptor subunit alpha-2 isoform X2 [Callorhinchus milii]
MTGQSGIMSLNSITVTFLALVLWASGTSAKLTSVGPPIDLQIRDLGLLGQLHIQWKAPLNLAGQSLCVIRYMLSYGNSDSTNCKNVITNRMEYTDGFNLNKEINVKIRTLVKGQCTNGTELQSNWTELVYRAYMEGHSDSKIKDLHCIVYNEEYMDCVWEMQSSAPHDVGYTLFYWHQELEQAEQCKNYIENQESKIGCHFYSDDLIQFNDFNICVNGSSENKPVSPAYFTFQLQDLVKPAVPDKINLTLPKTDEIYLEWEPPSGKIPPHCFEYQLDFRQRDFEWKSELIIEETTFILSDVNPQIEYCFRLRATVNMFCADRGFWSEWSPVQCSGAKPVGESTPIALLLLMALIPVTLVLCILALYFWIKQQRFTAKKLQWIDGL